MRIPGFRPDMSPNDPEPNGSRLSWSANRAAATPTDVLSIVNSSTQALLRAGNDLDALRVLLSAAADLGAAKPKAGLWRAEDAAYAMWFFESASGEAVPCGSAPAALYNGAPSLDDAALPGAPVMRLGARKGPWGVLDVSGQIADSPSLNALALLARSAVLRLDAGGGAEDSADEGTLIEAIEQWWIAPNTEALLRAVVEDVARLCRADSCAVTLVEPSTCTLRLLFHEDLTESGAPLPWMPATDERRNGEALRRVVATCQPLAFRWNPVTEALKEGLLPTGPSEGSYAAQPLIEADRAIGVLDIRSRTPRRFGPAQDATLAYAARTVARILGQRDRALCQVESRRRQDILLRVTGDLANQVDLKPMAEVLARTTHEMWPDADITYTMLPQVEGGLWSIAALESQRADDQRQGWARAGEGFAGWVIQTKQPLTISAAADDPRRGSLDRGLGVAAGMWAPMKRGDAMFGLLAVASREGGPAFGPDDQEALELLAGQGAVALERARERHGTQSAFWDAIEAIAAAIDARDGYTHGHSRNVTEYAIAIAQRIDLAPGEIHTLRAAALLHDIGKIGIPDHILNKPGALSPDERTIMESHPEIGYEILLRAPSLQALLPGVRYHHERPDGRGYPVGLGEEGLPLQARIIAVADAFDAMTSDRVYRKRMTVEKASSLLREGRGSQWDAGCVDAFLGLIEARATTRLQMLAAEDSGRQYLPSLGADVFGQG